MHRYFDICIEKTEVPYRLLICNKSWTTHIRHKVSERKGKRTTPTSYFFTWDASSWANVPDKIRRLFNNSVDDIQEYAGRKHMQQYHKDQKFRENRFELLGPDISAATFIVARGGKAKFNKYLGWTTSTSASSPLPTKKVKDVLLEGLDASGMTLLPVGLDNLWDLEHLTYLNLSKLSLMTDWHLFKLGRLWKTLEFLDISRNNKITDEGLASLHVLKNLKCLDISDCKGLKNPTVVCAYLSDFIPDLTVVGLDSLNDSPAEKSSLFEIECKELRYLNMGEQLDAPEETQDTEAAQLSGPPEDGTEDVNSEVPSDVDREPLKKAARG